MWIKIFYIKGIINGLKWKCKNKNFRCKRGVDFKNGNIGFKCIDFLGIFLFFCVVVDIVGWLEIYLFCTLF